METSALKKREEDGFAAGKAEKTLEIACQLKQANASVELIAKATGLSIDEIVKL